MAKVEITLGDKTYTDYQVLLRLAAGWKIAKLFASRSGASPGCVDTTPRGIGGRGGHRGRQLF